MEIHDVVIVGGGISAHTASLYTARANLKPIIISAIEPDQLSLTTVVENFPGFPEGVLGPELVKNCRKQAEKFGAKYVEGFVDSFKINGNYFEIGFGKEKLFSRTVIISTGASAKKLNVKGEDNYFGRGVSTCAVCDAFFFKNKDVVVVGGGDSAMEESFALYKFAKKVTLIHRRDQFRASKIMQDRFFNLMDKISVIWNSEVTEVLGDGKFVKGVKIKNSRNHEAELKCDGVFLAIGHVPNTNAFENVVELDELGFVKTDKRMKTNVPGVFAAGDCQDHIFKQAVTAAGSGCMAALEAERYIENLKAKGEYD